MFPAIGERVTYFKMYNDILYINNNKKNPIFYYLFNPKMRKNAKNRKNQ